ncbi:hypothetical protein [Oscillospiraceae bacterium]|nr:hypothetical protein [Oscillospiraceae bacterium]
MPAEFRRAFFKECRHYFGKKVRPDCAYNFCPIGAELCKA